MRDTDNHYVIKDPKTGKLQTICLETGEVVSQEGMDLSKYKFDMNTAILVCQHIREGLTLKKLCQKLGIDMPILHYWQRTNPQFKEEMKLARKERAEYYHDRVLEIADEVMERDEIPVARFKADQYKWAAEKGDPEVYGNKTQVSGSIENQVSMIVLNTGIRRNKPDIEVSYERKEDQSDSRQQVDGDIGEGLQADVQAAAKEEDENSEEAQED